MALSARAEKWSFIVAGDGRTNPHADPGDIDQTGINTHVFTNLLQAVQQDASHPRFLLYSGDLVLGTNAAVKASLPEQFETWKKLAGAGLPGLPVYPVRGNHEIYGDPNGSLWLTEFKPLIDNNHVMYLPGEEGFSYYFFPPCVSNAVVIALDQFQPANMDRINLGGLGNALKDAKARGAGHIFVFAHEMAFTCTSHSDSENMAAHPADRDKFLELLKDYGCQYFFAGHDHAYDWMTIQHTNWPADYTLNQIVCGTAGAPFYQDKGYFGDHGGFNLTRLDHKQKTYGYLRVVVDDEAVTNQVSVTFVTVKP